MSDIDYNLYKTSGYLDAYSKNGALSDPISQTPEYTYSAGGACHDFHLFGRNDGAFLLAGLTIFPTTLGISPDRRDWFKFASTQVELDTATAGEGYLIGNANSGDTADFWMRICVPEGVSQGVYRDIRLRIHGG